MTHSGAFTVRSFAIAGAALFAANALPDDAFAQDRYAAIVIDVATNEVLHQDAADERRFPASLTKMMTLYMLFEALERGDISLEDRMVASRHAARQPPSRLGVRRGDVLTVEQAIGALVVQSANDVAAMVAERLGGTESNFAAQMTARARQLGMTNTRFMNASGLPNPEIRTTARDMATLSIAIWRDFPQYYHYFQMPTNSWRGREGRNHNRLLGQVEGVDGIKTGYTRASGFNLATATVRNGRRVITVVLGGETAAARDAQVAYLIEGAFEELARRQELDPANVNFVSRNVQNVNATLMRAGRPVGPLQGPLDPTALLPVEQGDASPDGEESGDASAQQAQ